MNRINQQFKTNYIQDSLSSHIQDNLTSESKLSTTKSKMGILTNVLNTNTLRLSIVLFLVLYAGIATNKVPDYILNILNNGFVKFLYLILWLHFVRKKDWGVAVIMVVIFLMTMKILSLKIIDNKINDTVNFLLYKNYIVKQEHNNKDTRNDKMKNDNKNNDSMLFNNSILFNNDQDNMYASF